MEKILAILFASAAAISFGHLARGGRKTFWIAGLLSMGLFARGAQAAFYSEQYEMTFSPDTVEGTVNGFTLDVADGAGTLGPSGSTFSGGIMTFLDDGNSDGDQGFYLSPSSTLLDGSSNYLADFRIRILQDNLPLATGKIMSFKTGNGRGLHMDTDGVEFVNGAGGVGTATGFDFTKFTECRLIVNGAANTIDLYVSTTGSVNTPASSYVNLASTTMGASGFAAELGTIGFALGSFAGGSTTLANFELDWFRVESGTTNLNSVWEVVREPGTTAPTITSINFHPALDVQIDFTADTTDTAGMFTLQSSSTVNGTYADVAPPATITPLSAGTFRAVTASSGNAQFYRIKR